MKYKFKHTFFFWPLMWAMSKKNGNTQYVKCVREVNRIVSQRQSVKE